MTPSADPTSATLTSDGPHYWTNHTERRVTAWWPYTEGETTLPAVKVVADQSAQKDFEGSDFIVAEEQTVSYGNTTLRFTHRTARVTVVLTDYTEEQMFVQLTGLSTADGNPDKIVPYDKGSYTYTVPVAPQSVATGTAFIACKFTNGKVFVYKMENDAEWKAGKEYIYTVSLAAAKDPGYTDDGKGNYTVNNEKGLKNLAELVNNGETNINITLNTDLDLTDMDWTPIGTSFDNSYSGTFDGVVGLSYGNIENCLVSGSVSGSGSSDVGGVVGYQQVGSITGCSSSATVNGTQRVGGVAEMNTGNSILACYAAGNVSGFGSGTIHVGGAVGGNYVTVTACYWSCLPDNDNGGATKVDGTTVTWQTAVDVMNAALQSAGSEWRYELTGELPTLKKIVNRRAGKSSARNGR